MKKWYIAIVVFIVFSSHLGYAQTFKKFPQGIQIELGGGYNQLFWKIDDEFAKKDADRTAFSLTPTIRVLYNISLSKHIYVSPFLGYNQFGGKNEESPNGYKDEFWFRSLEIGTLIFYQANKIRVGGGLKLNNHLKTYSKHYGSASDEKGTDRSWTEENWTDEFPTTSYDIGLRMSYRVRSKFQISGDLWFGLSDIIGESIFGKTGSASGRENHYRILLGYEL